MSVRVHAPAKINLTLKVGRPRADGMHPLQSVVAFADIGDIVEAEEAGNLSLIIHGDFASDLTATDDNLVLRAARALAEAAGRPAHARLSLEKNLPIASGIGGGSADAAATLRALNTLWGLDWPKQRLAEIARPLGADVPVFFSGGASAVMTGIGEIIAPMRMPQLAAVLINPLAPLATPDVYRAFDAMNLGADLSSDPPAHWETAAEAIAAMRAAGNDLEAPARALMPAIDDIFAALEAHQSVRYAALSGSGATVFAITDDLAAAESLTDALIENHPQWWVAETTLGA